MPTSEPLKAAKLVFADAVIDLYDNERGERGVVTRANLIKAFDIGMARAKQNATLFQKERISWLEKAFQDLLTRKEEKND